MPIIRKKKVIKRRGSKTHGWGTEKHRGAGSRGGRGMAGSGKRADQKKISIFKEYGDTYFGRRKGFVSRFNKIKGINVGELDKLIERGLAKEENGFYVVDLKDKKLLGAGEINKKFKIKVSSFSKQAEEKIKKAGGELVK